MGSGPSNAFSDPSDPNWVPGSSDFERLFGNSEFFTAPISGSFLRDSTSSLAADEQWHNLRFDTAQWDVDPEGGVMHSGTTWESFTINTTGLYEVAANERFSSSTTGYLLLRCVISGGSELARAQVPFVALNPYTAEFRRRVSLTAGQVLIFQHFAFSGQDVTLRTDNPRSFVEIHYCGRKAA